MRNRRFLVKTNFQWQVAALIASCGQVSLWRAGIPVVSTMDWQRLGSLTWRTNERGACVWANAGFGYGCRCRGVCVKAWAGTSPR